MEIYKEFSFDAAHFLPKVPEGHRCGQVHGHTYYVKIFIQGDPGESTGWVIDFKEIKNKVGPVIDELDHSLLNNITGLENPTAENVTTWMWKRIKPLISQLSRIELKETPTTGVVYTG